MVIVNHLQSGNSIQYMERRGIAIQKIAILQLYRGQFHKK